MIEIHGAGFQNKGAQLMCEVVMQRLRQWDPATRCCVEAGVDRGHEATSPHSLYYLWPPAPVGRLRLHSLYLKIGRLVGRALPPKAFTRFGLASRDEPDALIDISGYAFGDSWPLEVIKNFTVRAKSYRRRGKPVVMLPQMFGPFVKSGFGDAISELLRNVDLVFARDPISQASLEKHMPQAPAVRPDITVFADLPRNLPPDAPVSERGFGILVPNMRMMDKGGHQWNKIYLDRLKYAGEVLRKVELDPLVLIHESGEGDQRLGRELAERLGPDTVTWHHSDPRILKLFISRSRLLVGSRFHAVLAAVSTGVPAIVLGWAHKYQMLLNDFGTPDNLFAADDEVARLGQLIVRAARDPERHRIVDILTKHKAEMADPANDMWAQVFSKLTS